MELRVLRECVALHLAVQALPQCEEASLVEGSEGGVSALWLQNLLSSQTGASAFGGTISIGRKPSSHILLKDRAISSSHGAVAWSLTITPCPSTQSRERSLAALQPGDVLRLRIVYTDDSTNGSYEGERRLVRGEPCELSPTLVRMPGAANALEPMAEPPRGTTVWLGRPRDSAAGGAPVFAFGVSLCVAEPFTASALSALSRAQLSAFPFGVTRHVFVGGVQDPRLARIKREVECVPERAAATVAAAPAAAAGSETEELRKLVGQLQSELLREKNEAERARVEREREAREKLSKNHEADMEIQLLKKKVAGLQQQTAALQQDKLRVAEEAQKAQEAYERSELKRAQTQALLEACEARVAELESERYSLAVAASQHDARVQGLEQQLRELERQRRERELAAAQAAAAQRAEQERWAAEAEQLRQQSRATAQEAQAALQDLDLAHKRQVKAVAKLLKEQQAQQLRALLDTLTAHAPPRPLLRQPQALPSTLPPTEADQCSATDGERDDAADDLETIGAQSSDEELDTPQQLATETAKENDRPKRSERLLPDDSLKRRRRSSSLGKSNHLVIASAQEKPATPPPSLNYPLSATDHLLLPDSQYS